MDIADKTGVLLVSNRIKKYYYSCFRALVKESGLNQNEIDVLLFLANNKDYNSAKYIVDMRGMTKSQVSQSVDELCKAGYIKKFLDDSDRRNTLLYLLPKAKQIVKKAQSIQNNVFRSLFAKCDDNDIYELQQITQKISAALAEAERNDVD